MQKADLERPHIHRLLEVIKVHAPILAYLIKFLSKLGAESSCMLDCKLVRGQQELVITLQDNRDSCMWLHVACMLHASHMH